jgi:hypothetical protein
MRTCTICDKPHRARGLCVTHYIRDEWPTDPLPVLAALASWEDMIRHEYDDGKGAVPANLADTVNYLTANLDARHNLAQTFHAFDELAAEIRHHRAAVHHAAALADDPVEADPECNDCGGPLLRTYRPPAEPAEVRRRQARQRIARATEPVRRQREAERSYGIRDLTPWPSDVTREMWREGVAGRKGEGLTDDWTCGWCRRTYTQPEYFLALRAKASSWVSLTLAAETAQRSVWTVRSWANRLLVSAACRVTDRRVVVWWPDVSDRAFRHAGDAESQRSA